MTRRLQALYPLAVCALLALGSAAAAVPDEDDPDEEADARWALSLATQVDQDSNRGFSGEVGYNVTPNTAVRGAVTSVDYTATNPNGFHSNGIEAGASHDFEHFGVDMAIGRWQDTDIVTAKELKFGGEYRRDPWSVGLRGGYRKSDFDAFKADTVVTLRTGARLPVSAVARCKLDNTALGITGRYDGDVWGAYATLMKYQYADSKCKFNAPGLDALSRAQLREFRQLAAGLVDRLSVVATRRIGYENTLLDSSIDVGGSWHHDELVVSLDYTRQKDVFTGTESNTVSTTGTADLGDSSGVDVTLGYTNGRTIKSAAFVGFAVRAHF